MEGLTIKFQEGPREKCGKNGITVVEVIDCLRKHDYFRNSGLIISDSDGYFSLDTSKCHKSYAIQELISKLEQMEGRNYHRDVAVRRLAESMMHLSEFDDKVSNRRLAEAKMWITMGQRLG